MTIACYHCGKEIRGKYKTVTPPKCMESWGEFSKSYHFKCYKASEKEAAKTALRDMGAELLKTEDRFGDTKSGWWLDGVYLGPTYDPIHCLNVVKGN